MWTSEQGYDVIKVVITQDEPQDGLEGLWKVISRRRCCHSNSNYTQALKREHFKIHNEFITTAQQEFTRPKESLTIHKKSYSM